ncbi:hypothetical protein L9F63_006052, partial [Diploptera punctata]
MWPLLPADLIITSLLTISNIFLPHKITKEVDVVIVGAGPSGIAAASRLLENGVDNIVVLEAEDRIGGRIHTVPLGDAVVDLGAQWVHGEEGNVVFNLAKQHNVLMETALGTLVGSNAYIDEEGRLIPASVADAYFKVYLEILDTAETQLHNYTGSLGDYFQQQYPGKLEQYSLSDTHLSELFFNWLDKVQGSSDASSSWYKTSGRGLTSYKTCPGDNWVWKTGYHTVLNLLMKKIPDESQQLPVLERVSLKSEVTEIVWAGGDKVQVTCANGITYLTPQVIVTTSLGVLKHKAHSIFQPPLPPTKLNAIRGLNIGTVDKIYLSFPYKWWPQNYIKFSFIRPDYKTTCRSKDCWVKNIFIFHEIDNHTNLLCGWLVGPEARIMEQMSLEDVKLQSVKLLQESVGKAFNMTVPEPLTVLRSTWYSNPHFRGSYSYRSLTTEALGVSAADLAEPILNSDGFPRTQFRYP